MWVSLRVLFGVRAYMYAYVCYNYCLLDVCTIYTYHDNHLTR